MLDLKRLREDTPGVERVLHFNNAGASLAPKVVVNSMVSYLQEEALRGGYELANDLSEEIDGAYNSLANLLGCLPCEIAITESGTRSWNSIVYGLSFKKGDKILVSRSEYGSNIASLRHICEATGAQLLFIEHDTQNQICLASLQKHLDENTKLVAVTHVACNSGVVNPIDLVGELVANSTAFYLVDACQSVGQIKIDVNAIKCDALVGTGRKWLRGPRGTGFAYIASKKESAVSPAQLEQYTLKSPKDVLTQLNVRCGAKKIELTEKNIAAVVGLGTAVDYAHELGMDYIENRVSSLSDYLRQGLSRIEGVNICDRGVDLCGIVTFTVKNIQSLYIKKMLAQNNINVAMMSSFLSPLLGFGDVVRASPHYYLQYEDLDVFFDHLRSIVDNFAKQ